MLKIREGGSELVFRRDVKCCIPSCGATNEEDRNVPFYSFPKSAELCKEWLREIQLDDDAADDLDKLYLTHAVCPVHFKPYEGGLRLFAAEGPVQKITKFAANLMNDVVTAPESTKSSKLSIETLLERMKSLKEDYGVDIICSKSVKCRVCASTLVPAMSIYDECNKKLNLEGLINSLLPIKVKPSDKKPLNICVNCVFQLKQCMNLFNPRKIYDTNFDSSSSKPNQPKNGNPNPSENKKNIDDSKIACIRLSNDENIIDKIKDTSDDHNEKLESIKLSKKSKLIKSSSKSKNLVKKKNSYQNPSDNKNYDDNKIPCIFISDDDEENGINENKNISNPNVFYKLESRNHKIKILVTNKNNNDKIQRIIAEPQNKPPQCSSKNNKVIDVEFAVKYIIGHGIEWIHEIIVDKEQLDYSQETIDHLLKVIQCTMKKQCEKNNSKVVPLPKPPSKTRRSMASKNPQQLQTKSVIIDGKKHISDEVRKKLVEMLKKKERRYHLQKQCCHLCGCRFKGPNNLSNHYRKHEKNEQLCCNVCNLQFINGFGLRKHIRQYHKEQFVKKNPVDILKERQKCPKCELWFSSKLSLRVHLKTHIPIKKRKKTCLDCNKVFINARRFKLHLKTDGTCLFKCPECNHSYPSKEHFDYHLHCHKVTEPVSCDICMQCFKSRTILNNHIDRVHQGVHFVQKKFTCLFCKIVFTNNDVLIMHSNTHTSEEIFVEMEDLQNLFIQQNKQS